MSSLLLAIEEGPEVVELVGTQGFSRSRAMRLRFEPWIDEFHFFMTPWFIRSGARCLSGLGHVPGFVPSYGSEIRY